MDKSPKVSVLMPVFNTPTHMLREAMDSILTQTFKDFELIIIDDGSTEDHVTQTIRSYDDDRILYLRKENSGIADALNYGWNYARGEYIARMDSDDISYPNRFERQLAYFESHKEYSLLGTNLEDFPNRRISDLPEDIKPLDFCFGCIIAHPSVMLRKADFDRYGLRYDPKMVPAEDYDLWTRAADVLRLGNVPEVLLKYRRNPTGICQTRGKEQADRVAEIKERYFKKYISSQYAKTITKIVRRETLRLETVYRFLKIPFLKVVTEAWDKKYYLFKKILILKVKTDIEPL